MARHVHMKHATRAVIAPPISGFNISARTKKRTQQKPGNKHRVAFVNRDWAPIDVGEDEAIIDAAESAGYVLPVGCRYGGCITCAARLVEGAVRQPNATALNQRQSRDGYILLCVAQPKTDLLIEVGVESHNTLYENPFANPDSKSLELLLCPKSR